MSADWVVQYGSRWLQVEKEQRIRVDRGATVTIREHRDGSISIWLDRVKLRWRELETRPSRPTPPPKRRIVTRRSPAAGHPWRQPWSAAHQLQSTTN